MALGASLLVTRRFAWLERFGVSRYSRCCCPTPVTGCKAELTQATRYQLGCCCSWWEQRLRKNWPSTVVNGQSLNGCAIFDAVKRADAVTVQVVVLVRTARSAQAARSGGTRWIEKQWKSDEIGCCR